MDKSQPDGTRPLPETSELGGEGGSYGDAASRESREHERGGVRNTDQPVSDRAGYATRLPDVSADEEPPAGKDVEKYPTEP